MDVFIGLEIFNSIADGKDGTLRLDGGGIPLGGYFVGGNGKPLVFDTFGEANSSEALKKINKFVEALSSVYVGWWMDSATGKYYIDGTDRFGTVEEASKAAFDRHEIAFWGVAEEAEFRFQYVQQQ